jgi:SAM-dependent methyltransferase
MLTEAVQDIDATPPRSGYSSYYDEKKEELSLNDSSGFLPKQKVVSEILDLEKPATVLDIGANTGWYSILAAKAGASVIALEQDESCADILYEKARRLGLRILPLTVSFSGLTREIFGAGHLQAEYADRNVTSIPLYKAGVDRFRADVVLVLGLVHHLVLGEGRTLSDVFEVLGKLAVRILVLEFVVLDDEKIVNEPSFFPNLHRSNASTYNLERAMEIGRRHFKTVEIRDSHPDTRKILILRK